VSQRRVTIRDVAEKAGCSIATVSRVLNQSGPASTDAAERVLAAADALGFSFNELGRSLQSQRSRTLGVIVPSLSNPVFAAAIEGVQAEATAAGYQILLACSNYDEPSEIQAIRTLIGKQIDGAVLTVVDPDDSPALALLKAQGVPYCLMFNQPETPQPSVGVDNVAASRMAADMLLQAGHRNTAFLAIRFDGSERARLRHQGFSARLLEAGCPEPALLEVGDNPQDLDARLGALFAAHEGITALYASNDMLALAAIRAVRALGLRVPEDVSVIGFDGIAIAEMVDPSLATIATPCPEMGRGATSQVITAINEDRTPAATMTALPFSFRTGGSLGLAGAEKPADERAPVRRRTHPTTPVTKHGS
jgi:DNA-binding LacI/PurR family transcriptional regulator